MAHDERRRRFFGYLNLFVAAMLLLVLADSYLLLFVGWEGVGLASYLLIGFWQHVPDYATAAKKAFIMNRVGDIGLLVAMFFMFDQFGVVRLRRGVRGGARGPATAGHRDRPACCCSAPSASRPSSRCRPGCSTRWPAPPRSPR